MKTLPEAKKRACLCDLDRGEKGKEKPKNGHRDGKLHQVCVRDVACDGVCSPLEQRKGLFAADN